MTRRRAPAPSRATTGQLVRSARNLTILAGCDAGISQAEIARALGLSPAQVSRVRAAMTGKSAGQYREPGDTPPAQKKGTPRIFLDPAHDGLRPSRAGKR